MMRSFLIAIIFSFFITCFSVEALLAQQKNAEYLYKNKKFSGYYKVGKPYEVLGEVYKPKIDKKYSEIGIASIYSPSEKANRTANGEKFNVSSVSAAHRTLPLPSIVKVTNLETGKWAYVRVNDRGPYITGRVIDLSPSAAKLVGMDEFGLAQVRVDYDHNQTLKMISDSSHISYKSSFNKANGIKVQKAEIVKKVPVKKTIIKAEPKKEFKKKVNDFVPKGPYYAQVGAFSDIKNVEKMISEMNGLLNFNVATASGSNGVIYKVRVGPFFDSEKSSDILSNLSKLGFKNAILVQQ